MNRVIIFNKPKGFTSQQAVTEVKKLLKVRKIGHAGTLDPIATGVLILCTNEATKITPFLIELEKEYVFKARFGITTDTFDSQGKIKSIKEYFKLDKSDLERIIKQFTGEILQIPPMYSAVKIQGEPLYKLARKGIEIERKAKRVFIHSIIIEEFEPPFVTFKVVCSKGTYVRALCHEIGLSAGVGAHVVELCRTRVGKFSIEDSIDLDELKNLIHLHPSKESTLKSHKSILSIDQALYFLPSIKIHESLIKRFQSGNSIKIPSGIVPAGWVKVKSMSDKILGIGYGNGVMIKPERIIWEEEA